MTGGLDKNSHDIRVQHVASHPDGAQSGRTLAQLIDEYIADPVSGYQRLRYNTRTNHGHLLRRMKESFGHVRLADIRSRTLEEMYLKWSNNRKHISTGHQFIAKLRTICGYGSGMLEDNECTRLCIALHQRRYEASDRRQEAFMTAEQATAIREKAREIGYFSIALAQALQFDCLLRQGDCIGFWVPLSEPEHSTVIRGDWKWVRGITWDEIDENLVLNHVTSKKQKRLILPLTECPMVMEEFKHIPDWLKQLGGPLIVNEATAYPWKSTAFRQTWRKIADICGIPKEIKSMHSRAGGISEGSDAGIPLEIMRHAAKHSDIGMTQRYSRNEHAKAAEAIRLRVEHRRAKQEAE